MINGAGHDFLRVQYVPRNLRGVAVTEEQNANGVSGRKGASRPSHGERRASSPHLNKTAVSCVYLVQSKREKERQRESWTDKRLQIVPVTNRRPLLFAHFWRGWLAGWLPKASSTSLTLCRPHDDDVSDRTK